MSASKYTLVVFRKSQRLLSTKAGSCQLQRTVANCYFLPVRFPANLCLSSTKIHIKALQVFSSCCPQNKLLCGCQRCCLRILATILRFQSVVPLAGRETAILAFLSFFHSVQSCIDSSANRLCSFTPTLVHTSFPEPEK